MDREMVYAAIIFAIVFVTACYVFIFGPWQRTLDRWRFEIDMNMWGMKGDGGPPTPEKIKEMWRAVRREDEERRRKADAKIDDARRAYLERNR